MDASLKALFSGEYLKTLFSDSKAVVAINKEGNMAEKRRMNHLINEISHSPAGRKVLEQAQEAGYTLCFVNQRGSYGYCDEEKKILALNPNSSDGALIGTLAHEARHAVQYENGVIRGSVYSPQYDMATQIKERRLMEADAIAYSVAVAKDLEARGNSDPMAYLRPSAFKMVEAYEENINVSKEKAMTEAVMMFYDTENLKSAYEREYVLKPLARGDAFENRTGDFKSYPVSESVSKICELDGKNYFTRPVSDLDTPKCAGVSQVSAEWIKQYAEDCDRVGVEQKDKSLEKLPVYELSPCAKMSASLNLPAPLTCTYPVLPLKERSSYLKNNPAVAKKSIWDRFER